MWRGSEALDQSCSQVLFKHLYTWICPFAVGGCVSGSWMRYLEQKPRSSAGQGRSPVEPSNTHDEYLLKRGVTAGLREFWRLKGSSTDVSLVVTVWYICIYIHILICLTPQKQYLSVFILNTTCWKHNRITLHLLLSTKDKEEKREQAKKGCGEREKERDEGSGGWKREALGKRGRRIWHRAGLAVLRRSVTAKRFRHHLFLKCAYAKPFQSNCSHSQTILDRIQCSDGATMDCPSSLAYMGVLTSG